MIDPETVRVLDSSQLRDLRRIDFDCQGMDCYDCPLGIEPVEGKTKSGKIFTYRCVSAYAAHLLEK